MAFEKYETLGLQPTASPDEIKRAYYRMVRQHPPEKHPDQFKAIRSAYETLSDIKARDAYDALERHGAQVAELASEAEKLMNAGEWEQATKRWKHILVLVPHAQAAWNSLGLCQLNSGFYQPATKTYAALTERSPEVPVYWYNYGAAYHEWANKDDTPKEDRSRLLKTARLHYRAAIEREDFNPTYYLAASRAYADEGQLDLAMQWARKAARCRREQKEEDLESLFWMCVLHVRRGSLEEISLLAQRIRMALPDSSDARQYAAARLASLGADLHRLGAFKPAVMLYNAAQEFDPADADIRALCAEAHALAQASAEFDRVKTDELLIAPMRMAVAVILTEASPVDAQTDEKELKEAMERAIEAMGNSPAHAVLASAKRIRDHYPATYRLRQRFYDALIEATTTATATRSGSAQSSCFVVTATFGTPWAAEVQACRRFRDEYLSHCALGRTLLWVYNRLGPAMAAIVRQSPRTRHLLAPTLGWLIRRLPLKEKI